MKVRIFVMLMALVTLVGCSGMPEVKITRPGQVAGPTYLQNGSGCRIDYVALRQNILTEVESCRWLDYNKKCWNTARFTTDWTKNQSTGPATNVAISKYSTCEWPGRRGLWCRQIVREEGHMVLSTDNRGKQYYKKVLSKEEPPEFYCH
jgi:hypothetical protein